MATAAGSLDHSFAARLGSLLEDTRRARGQSRGALARQGSLSRTQLREVESGTASLDDALISEVVALYGADIGELLSPRRAISVDISGSLSLGGSRVGFDPVDDRSLLVTYLRLVRQVRGERQEPVIALRREDIDVLADFLCLPGADVVEQLADLMGVTQHRRRSMVSLFTAGATVIGLASTVVALGVPAATPATSLELAQGGVTSSAAEAALVNPPEGSAAPSSDAPTGELVSFPAPRSTPVVADLPAPVAPAATAPTAPVAAAAQVEYAASSSEATLVAWDASVPSPATEVAGEPPVPVAEPEPGREVAVGRPPAPPFPVVDGDREVAVGLPPVPPTLDPPAPPPTE